LVFAISHIGDFQYSCEEGVPDETGFVISDDSQDAPIHVRVRQPDPRSFSFERTLSHLMQKGFLFDE
jgi:hypothetical protein